MTKTYNEIYLLAGSYFFYFKLTVSKNCCISQSYFYSYIGLSLSTFKIVY
jgi:hypothetical protein